MIKFLVKMYIKRCALKALKGYPLDLRELLGDVCSSIAAIGL